MPKSKAIAGSAAMVSLGTAHGSPQAVGIRLSLRTQSSLRGIFDTSSCLSGCPVGCFWSFLLNMKHQHFKLAILRRNTCFPINFVLPHCPLPCPCLPAASLPCTCFLGNHNKKTNATLIGIFIAQGGKLHAQGAGMGKYIAG